MTETCATCIHFAPFVPVPGVPGDMGGFGNCRMLAPSLYVSRHFGCHFTPSRYEAPKEHNDGLEEELRFG